MATGINVMIMSFYQTDTLNDGDVSALHLVESIKVIKSFVYLGISDL